MKKLISYMLLISCMLSLVMFSGCDLFKKANPSGDPLSADPVYELEFTSNGDGTCYVSQIITPPTISELYTVEIPETSPDNETVIGVKPELICTVYRNLPIWILAEDFDAVCATAKENGLSGFDYIKMTAFFKKMSVEGLAEQDRAQLLEAFPLAEYVDFYVLDSSANADERARISQQLFQYAQFDEQKKYESDLKIIDLANEHIPEIDLDFAWHYTTFMNQLVLPATVCTVKMPSSAFDQIIYAGTVAQWESVSCELNNVLGTKVTCSDGEVTLTEELVTHDAISFDVQFLCGISEDVVVTPESRDSAPLTSYSLVLGETTRLNEYYMLKSEYEVLLAKMEQEGYGSVAEKLRGRMEVNTIGSIEYVQVPSDLIDGIGYEMPKSYYGQKMLEFCEKTRVAPMLRTLNSEHFVGLALPGTLQYFSLYVRSPEVYLKDIYFDGTMEQWQQVEVIQHYYPEFDLSYVTVHCTDGEIPLTVEHRS